MKKILFFTIIFIINYRCLYSQSAVSQGKPFAEIFTDFHYNLDDTSKTTGFGLNRAYLGYHYTPQGKWSAFIVLNLGNPEDLPAGSVPKRYAYVREASLTYTMDRLKVNLGMVSTRFCDFQQGFWGKRYLGPEYQSVYGYSSVADLGIVIDYVLNDILKFDAALLNGEGYTNIQVDNSLKTAVGVTITTPGKIVVRFYGDYMKLSGISQTTMLAFAGFKNDDFCFGAEASYKTNLDLTQAHDVWGLSATGSVSISKNSELFGRYDYTASLKSAFSDLQWDYEKDATYFIGGIQHTFSDNVKMALNYRIYNPYKPGIPTTNAIYVNASFRF